MCTEGSEKISLKKLICMSMISLHSLRGNGSITIKGLLGISVDIMEENAFGITQLTMDEFSPNTHSPIKLYDI